MTSVAQSILNYTHPAEAAAVLTSYLSSSNIPYQIINLQSGQPNFLSDFERASGPGPRVVLNGHIGVFPIGDTAGWSRDPWPGGIEGAHFYGCGVVDMKSGIASLVIAYDSLYQHRDRLRGSVALCVVSDEETGGRRGSTYFLEEDLARWGDDVMQSFINRPPRQHSQADRQAQGSKIITRSTINFGATSGVPPSHKVNMTSSTCAFELDIRVPIGLTQTQDTDLIRSIAPKYKARINISVQAAASNHSSVSSLSDPMLDLLAEISKFVAPVRDRAVVVPSVGATYCKHSRHAVAPAYLYECSPQLAQVSEYALIREFHHITKVHVVAVCDFLKG
ncbi:putative acetylornithine deacetylase [Calycina marina]|uniref:Acetylornithine deacetylase n=1 Tax=Calycina marina TaxID=1763456 RepID=A0A9P7Z3I9_9HELO|nr:putative acetylornithine deacetylase [Calycina marina]